MDERDAIGHVSVVACIVPPWLLDHRKPKAWPTMANRIHDQLPYSSLTFFPKAALLTSVGMKILSAAFTPTQPPKGKHLALRASPPILR